MASQPTVATQPRLCGSRDLLGKGSCTLLRGWARTGASRSTPPPWRVTIQCASAAGDDAPLLLRVAKGQGAERTPVWLMRQAGRYMAAFRQYSDKIPFRKRSETPDIAVELSLQPWRAFGTDAVIMFSDILTVLPALGIEFDMVKGRGPVIADPIRSLEDAVGFRPLEDPSIALPFIGEILGALRREINEETALLGFVGSPWTLAAYVIEGEGGKNLLHTKGMMLHDPELLHKILKAFEDALTVYVCHQIDCGAQAIQIFDSWAHHLTPSQFAQFSLPYAESIIRRVRAARPEAPLIFHANGGTGKLHLIKAGCSADVVSLDWGTDMASARMLLGPTTVLQGNVDPLVLLGPEEVIRSEVARCISNAGGHHILNLGHGVIQGTPEEAVRLFCSCVKESSHELMPA